MAGGDLFGDLPPPASAPQRKKLKFSTHDDNDGKDSTTDNKEPSSAPPPPPPQTPPPALKSALKRPKPSSSILSGREVATNLSKTQVIDVMKKIDIARATIDLSETQVMDAMKLIEVATIDLSETQVIDAMKKIDIAVATIDLSETQVIDAMKKIAFHIKNPSKFSKASKLAIQLIQAGSVKPATSDHFFAILEVAMSSLTTCNEASLRADYHALFSAAKDAAEFFNKKQKSLLSTWTIRAVLANDLLTDDSFVFSKATARVKEDISSLPVATKDDDEEEAAALDDQIEVVNHVELTNRDDSSSSCVLGGKEEEPDPFGLDALIPSTSKKDDRAKGNKKETAKTKMGEEEEAKKSLRRQREALISCLEIAAKRYKTPWCQTAIDILVKHAFDNISKFTSRQRDAIDKLWASIREQGRLIELGMKRIEILKRLEAVGKGQKTLKMRRGVGPQQLHAASDRYVRRAAANAQKASRLAITAASYARTSMKYFDYADDVVLYFDCTVDVGAQYQGKDVVRAVVKAVRDFAVKAVDAAYLAERLARVGVCAARSAALAAHGGRRSRALDVVAHYRRSTAATATALHYTAVALQQSYYARDHFCRLIEGDHFWRLTEGFDSLAPRPPAVFEN